MKRALRHLFDFSDRERKGSVFLVLLIACASVVRIWFAHQKPVTERIDFTDLDLQLSIYQWQEELAGNEHAADHAAMLPEADQLAMPSLDDFDPNTVTREELLRMGCDPKLAQTLINYRSKGGVFRTRDDLKKIYGMNAGEFNRISPYVRIGEDYLLNVPAQQNDQPYSISPETYGHLNSDGVMSRISPALTELNAADTSALIRLKGIGPVLASRIVKYRNLLGGFTHKEQLGEVYGISGDLLVSLQDAVYADTTFLERIDINHASALQLSRHPYIGRYYADGIVLYREYKGSVHSMEELVANGLLPGDRAQKLKDYLVFKPR